jgi:ComF family protein
MLLDLLLSLFAPHHCLGCGVAGSGLCNSCKNDIIDEPYPNCLVCSNSTSHSNICTNCQISTNISRAFVLGKNQGILKKLIYDYKFKPARGLSKDLSDILDKILPILPKNTVIVPISTIPKHIRERGFGHIELIAKQLARKRHLKYYPLLARTDNSVQHGLKEAERAKVAAKTFSIEPHIKIPKEILLIDDIYTTGETVKSAAKLLKNSGVKTINVAIFARQTK